MVIVMVVVDMVIVMVMRQMVRIILDTMMIINRMTTRTGNRKNR